MATRTRRRLLVSSAGFLGLAILTAHAVDWLGAETHALYAYPAVWALAVVVLAIPAAERS
ncbi:hypothetical protein [uncultured Bifidobacterium sp.]|uniref:hypothetical protein n=1 Tax=uncultured Bifidobacterium sp. TaxID=165187 RepID=UPI0028DD397C|nr:hypothetical protein [uncultured Bifidobacterium sp.]